MSNQRALLIETALDGAGNAVKGARFRICKPGTSSGYGTGVVVADTLYADRTSGATLTNPVTLGANATQLQVWANVNGTDLPGYVDIEWDDNEGEADPSGESGYRPAAFMVSPFDVVTSPGGNPWEDARSYGATGDGVTDDTAAITAAITAAGAGIVFLPPGTYSVSGLTASTAHAVVRGSGMGITTIKARAGAVKVLDVAGTATDVVIQDLTIDGNGIATHGLYAETLATRGTADRIEVKGCTTAGIANADQNHSWSFDRCHVHDNTGRGVIWIKRGQNTRFSRCLIYQNTLGQVKLGDGVTAMSLITFNYCMIQSISALPNVPNVQVSAQINPLILRDTYFESFGASGTDITVDAGLSVSTVVVDGGYSNGNAQANYGIVLGSQTYLYLLDSQLSQFAVTNINDTTTTSRIFHINMNENGAVRVPFLAERVNPRFSVVVLTDGATVGVDPRLGRFFTLSTAASRAMGAPSAPTFGMSITFDITNTSGGNITPTWNAAYLLGNGNVGPTIAAGKHHILNFYYNATNALWIETGRSGDIG